MRARIAVLGVAIASVVAFQAAGAVPETNAGALSAKWELALDCAVNTAGIQSTCTQVPGATFDVAVVAKNIEAYTLHLGAFGGTVLNPDMSRLVAREPGVDLPACNDPGARNCNPDFNQAAMWAPNDWGCQMPPPEPDYSFTTEPGQDSFISCVNNSMSGNLVGPGLSIVLWTIHYRVPGEAPTGAVPLSLYEAGIYDSSLGEAGTCEPIYAVAMICTDAVINVGQVSLSFDCLPGTLGIQSSCMVSNLGTNRDVRVSLTNHGTSGILVNAFEFVVQNPDVTRIVAPVIDLAGDSNDNPDATALAEAAGWSCGPPSPEADQAATTEPGQDSFLGCVNNSGAPFAVAVGATVQIATVRYDIVPGADPGPVQLTLTESFVVSQAPSELGSCAPVVVNAMPCNGATLTLYCPIDMADVNNDDRVNVADIGLTAQKFGVLPAPVHLDQNFDGVINVADRGIVATHFTKRPSIHCP